MQSMVGRGEGRLGYIKPILEPFPLAEGARSIDGFIVVGIIDVYLEGVDPDNWTL